MTKKVLVPLDGSQNAEEALRIVNDLAMWQEIELVLLKVLDDEVVPYPAVIGGLDLHAEVVNEARTQSSSEYMKGIAGQEKSIINDVKSIIKSGDPGEVIVATADEEEIDLIIMVTHGYGLFERLLIGSVTEKVVRDANCPVFAIRDGHLPQHFLIALDGTAYSENILPMVFELANFFSAKVTLTTVRRPQDMPKRADYDEIARIDRRLAANMVAIESGRPAHYLDRIRKEYMKKFNVDISYDVEVGDPGRSIVRIAERNECDVIAMVTHGRKGLDWLLKGSVTEKVMHKTDAAMFVLHQEAEEATE